MATGNERYQNVVSTLTALGIGGLLIKNGKTSAATAGFPPEVIEVLQGLAEGMGVTIEQLNEIITAIGNVQPGGGNVNVQGYPPNCNYMAIAVIDCQLAMTSYRVPDYPVPDGFTIMIHAHPNNPFGSLAYWSTSPAANVNSSDPMMPNDIRTPGLKNTGGIYVFSTVAGCQVIVAVEQRS